MICLMPGDCLDVLPLVADGSVDMILADPPYGTTRCKWDAVIPFAPMWQQLKRIIKPNGAIVMTASQPFTTALIASNYEMFKYCWIWEKDVASNFLNANRTPLKRHEDVVVFYGKLPLYNKQMLAGAPYLAKRYGNDDSGACYGDVSRRIDTKNTGGRNPISIIKFNREVGLHPTQKPVALMEYLIKTYTLPGQLVLDFSMGSGTTGVACVNLGRQFIGIEKDMEIFKTASKRIDGVVNSC